MKDNLNLNNLFENWILEKFVIVLVNFVQYFGVIVII